MTNRTTINIKKEIREALKKIRKHRRETYDDILERDPRIKKILSKVKKS